MQTTLPQTNTTHQVSFSLSSSSYLRAYITYELDFSYKNKQHASVCLNFNENVDISTYQYIFVFRCYIEWQDKIYEWQCLFDSYVKHFRFHNGLYVVLTVSEDLRVEMSPQLADILGFYTNSYHGFSTFSHTYQARFDCQIYHLDM